MAKATRITLEIEIYENVDGWEFNHDILGDLLRKKAGNQFLLVDWWDVDSVEVPAADIHENPLAWCLQHPETVAVLDKNRPIPLIKVMRQLHEKETGQLLGLLEARNLAWTALGIPIENR
jgi:hypothetical protein